MPQLFDPELQTGVYLIVNTLNDKVYVGSASISFKQRWKGHRDELRGDRHKNRHLQRAWNKYGESSFEFVILEVCKQSSCVDREQYWMDFYEVMNKDKGYNISPTAGSTFGVKFSEAVLERHRLLREDPEFRAKMKEAARLRNADSGYEQALADGIRKRNENSEYRKNLKRANKLEGINSETKTRRAIAAIKQHKEGRFK